MALSMLRTAFRSFLANAKGQTYAAQGDDAMVIPFLPASHQASSRGASHWLP